MKDLDVAQKRRTTRTTKQTEFFSSLLSPGEVCFSSKAQQVVPDEIRIVDAMSLTPQFGGGT
jgi:hypothetical protein